jgi:iron complex outermembrane receptor protein
MPRTIADCHFIVRRELLVTTILATFGTVASTATLAQTATQSESPGSVALPTIDVEGARSNASGGRFTGYNAVEAISTKAKIPLLQNPGAIQVVPREVLDDQQAISVQDGIVGNVSSVTLTGPQLGGIAFTIRGFNIGQNYYLNGLRQPQTLNIDTQNLQSIEVVKGPAAMLYGRIEPGGLVNLVPKRPLFVPYYDIQEQIGSYGFTRTTLDATGPLNLDRTLAYRVNLDYTYENSFRDFVSDQNFFIAPSITYRPSDQFVLNIDGQYQKYRFVDDTSGLVAVGNGPARIPISRYLEDPSVTTKYKSFQERGYFGYDWTYKFTPDWAVTNRFSYNTFTTFTAWTPVTAFTPATGLATRGLRFGALDVQALATNLDLTGKLETGSLKHNVLVGVDYYNENHPNRGFIQRPPGGSGILPVNIYNPVYNGTGLPAFPDNNFVINRDNWIGVYGQDMISFADDRLHLLLGGRYDWAEFNNTFTIGTAAQAAAAFQARNANAFSPRLGAVVQPLPWLSFYGSYTRSLGTDSALFAGATAPLEPQHAVQYEGGVKAEFFDRRLTATLTFYDIQKTNIVQSTNVQNVFENIDAESRGIEVDVTGRLNENWNVIANYSHTDTRITKDVNATDLAPGLVRGCNPGTVNGNTGCQLAGIPLDSGNFWLKYDADGWLKGFSAGGGMNIVGTRYGDNENTFQLPAYAIVNAMAAYRFVVGGLNITAQINVRNLFDQVYYSSVGTPNATRFRVYPGTPRTVLGSLRVEF